MVRCRSEPTRWPLLIDVNNHLTELNPDVPDFQPGKLWKNDAQCMRTEKDEITTKNELNLNQTATKRKKPTKKKV